MNKVLTTILTFFLLVCSSVLSVSGHGLGQTLTKDINGYAVELEYESLEITADEPVEYGLRLIEKESGEFVDFDSLALRILDKQKDSGVFSTSISGKDSAGLGPRVYLKLEEGEYTFRLTFYKGEEELAAETFDLAVLPGEVKENNLAPAGLGFLAGAVIAGMAFMLLKKSK